MMPQCKEMHLGGGGNFANYCITWKCSPLTQHGLCVLPPYNWTMYGPYLTESGHLLDVYRRGSLSGWSVLCSSYTAMPSIRNTHAGLVSLVFGLPPGGYCSRLTQSHCEDIRQTQWLQNHPQLRYSIMQHPDCNGILCVVLPRNFSLWSVPEPLSQVWHGKTSWWVPLLSSYVVGAPPAALVGGFFWSGISVCFGGCLMFLIDYILRFCHHTIRCCQTVLFNMFVEWV